MNWALSAGSTPISSARLEQVTMQSAKAGEKVEIKDKNEKNKDIPII
jgi:hypothetical protein